MKIAVLLFGIILSLPQLTINFQRDVNDIESQNGSINGVVRLASKASTNRSGGGLYGRSARHSAQTTSTDSVLVILTGNSSSQSNSRNHTILNQLDRKFQPSILPVQVGQTVRITNSDPVYHNVFSLTSPHKFDVGRRPKGEHFDVAFEKPGMVDVFCDIHSNMHAIIYVLPQTTVQWQKIANGEMFDFKNITPGNYSVQFFALGYSEFENPVLVTENQVANLGTITLNP